MSQSDFVTREDVDKHRNILETVKASFGVEDDFLAAILANQVQMGRIEQRENELVQQLVDLNRSITPDGEIVLPLSYQFEFSTDVPADTSSDSPVETEREIPFPGRIKTLTVGWPDGANNTTGVQLSRRSGEKLFPRNPEDQFVAANDFTGQFDLRADVPEGSELVARFANTDTNNSHFVNVIATVERREG